MSSTWSMWISCTLSRMSRRLVSLSTRTRSTAVIMRPMMRCLREAKGLGRPERASMSSPWRWGSSSLLMKSNSRPSPLANSSCRFQPNGLPSLVLGCSSWSAKGAAQSCQRYGLASAGVKVAPTASASPLAFSSWASRMRRNRIQVSSGTYCRALAQLERRMMSQIDLTKADSDWAEAMALGCFFREDFLVMRLFPVLSRSLQWWANSSAVARATSP